MRITPYHVIGASSVIAIIVFLINYYETSPKVTDTQRDSAQIEVQTPGSAGQPDASPASEAEISVDSGMGITLARIAPDGSAVISGNAPEGYTVNLYSQNENRIIGTTLATEGGEWVIIPDAPLSPGAHLLTAEIVAPDGSVSVGPLALAIEIPASGDVTPLVALVPYTGEASGVARVLQAPGDEVNGQKDTSPLTIRSIQALNTEFMSVSGRAKGGATVTFSVNGVAADPVRPDDRAMYSVLLPIEGYVNTFKLRGRLRNAEGKVVATARITLTRGQVEKSLGNNTLIVIQKGDALWRIAYRTYGQGIRYIDIYLQNTSSIDDPDLIYPDQIFVIPKG
jgi:hypothetical protein